MAITKTTVTNEVRVLKNRKNMDGQPMDDIIQLFVIDNIDDPNDDLLPITRDRIVSITKTDENGDLTDLSVYEDDVQAICNAVWA